MVFVEKIRNIHQSSAGDSYPFTIPAIKTLREMHFRKDVTFIIGENGSGKSTLIEAIATKAGFNPEGGTKNFNFSTKETHSNLYEEIILTRGVQRERDGFFMRAESLYNVATEIEKLGGLFHAYGGKSLHDRSHGESFISIFEHRLGGNGLYIFDEPESALSPQSIFYLMVRMKELIRNNSQFIIATHSPLLLAFPGADIFAITESGWEKQAYEDTELYRISKYFLNNYEVFLKELLSE